MGSGPVIDTEIDCSTNRCAAVKALGAYSNALSHVTSVTLPSDRHPIDDHSGSSALDHSRKHNAIRPRGPAVIARTTRGSAIALAKPSLQFEFVLINATRDVSGQYQQQIHFAIVRLRRRRCQQGQDDQSRRNPSLHITHSRGNGCLFSRLDVTAKATLWPHRLLHCRANSSPLCVSNFRVLPRGRDVSCGYVVVRITRQKSTR